MGEGILVVTRGFVELDRASRSDLHLPCCELRRLDLGGTGGRRCCDSELSCKRGVGAGYRGTGDRVEKLRLASGSGWLTSRCFALLWLWLLGLQSLPLVYEDRPNVAFAGLR